MFPKRILLVEDTPTDAELISRQLRKGGCEFVEIAEDRDEVLSQLDKNWDLIVSDYNLPGFKGIDVLNWAREKSPHIAFIVCSGVVGDEKAAEVIKTGADDFISKDNLKDRLSISVERSYSASKARTALHLTTERLSTIVNNIQESTLLITRNKNQAYRLEQVNPQFIALISQINPNAKRLDLKLDVSLFSFLKLALNPSEQFLNKISYGLDKTFDQSKNSSFQESLILKNGNRIILAFSGVPLKDESDTIHQSLILIRDITSQIETEEYILTSTLEAQEKERRRLSYELHDSIGQSLSAAVLSMNKVLMDEADMNEESKEKLKQAIYYTNTGIQEARAIAHNLLPKSVEEAGLEDAIDNMLNSVTSVSNINFSFNSNLHGARLAKDREINIFRICQEAVNNIIRHSTATEGSIQIMTYDEVLILTIDDNGSGFDAKSKKLKNGIGVGGMMSRTKAMGGDFEISSKPDKGTHILIEIPVQPNN
jgi:signal transduction histidine kinase